MQKLLGKLISPETKIVIEYIKRHPNKFTTDIDLFSVPQITAWSALIKNGAFPWHEKILIDLTIRKVKLIATKSRIYALLID